MKKNFKLVSLLTIFTVVLNVLSVLVLMKPAMAAGELNPVTDTMSSLLVTAGSTHTIGFTPATDDTTTFVVTFAPEFVNNVGAATVTGGTCVVVELVVTCTATTDWGLTPITDLVVTGMANPQDAGSYSIGVLNGTATGSVSKAIVDPSIDVEVNGYINSSLSFDIDTTTADSSTFPDCDASGGLACLAYEGGPAASAYTVDLGNLTVGAVNQSGVTALHSDSGNGKVNFIYFDLSTNAADGAVVTANSLNGGLKSATDMLIPADDAVTIGSETYGIKFTTSSATGDINAPADACSGVYCLLVAATPVDVVNTTGAPVEGGRVQVEVAASIDALTNPGVYTDTLTFVATATF